MRRSPPDAQLAAGLAAANAAAAEGGATTLVLAVIDPGGELRLARVGDSTAFLISDGGGVVAGAVQAPDDDALITATAALPADVVDPELVAVTTTPEDLLLLATDGVADPWRDGPATVAPTLAAALSGRPGPLELAHLAGFSRRGCHDDRTMLVVWRRQPAD